jgi:isocitrate dehydrogenase kinase/phosphatase
MASEPWYAVAPNDVFPEEFGHFLLGNARVRAVFNQYHAELLAADFWRERQRRIRAGELEDVFPYPAAVRFAQRFPASFPHSNGV